MRVARPGMRVPGSVRMAGVPWSHDPEAQGGKELMIDQARTSASILIGTAILLLALPALAVHAWMAATFPSYLHGSFGQDLVFVFAWCGLLVLAVRWRLLHIMSITSH